MFSASQERLFNPLPDNPLHGGNGGPESSSEGSRMLVDNVSSQQTSKSNFRSPDASPRSHHVRWSDPLCQVTTFMTQTQTTDTDNISIPPMKLIPAFLLVPLGQVEQPGVVPVIPFVSGFPQSLSSPSKYLENVTRANLRPLMLSKGIITSPALPVQAVPQAQESIPPQSQYLYTQQSFPTFPISIQLAQPPVLQDIGLNNRNRGLAPEGDSCSSESDAASASENYTDTDTENVGGISVPQFGAKQPHKQGHAPQPFANSRKKSPSRGPFKFNPYDPGNRRQFVPRKNAKLKVIEWKNSLSRFWFLLERGSYNEKEHHGLMSLLSEINENKSHVTTEWLKNTKITKYLEKFEKEEAVFDYDPLVREVVGRILQFWNKELPLS